MVSQPYGTNCVIINCFQFKCYLTVLASDQKGPSVGSNVDLFSFMILKTFCRAKAAEHKLQTYGVSLLCVFLCYLKDFFLYIYKDKDRMRRLFLLYDL